MGKKVSIPVENIAFERLDLSRHYLTVDCDFTCFLVLNPSGDVPCEGTDICALHTGAWQIDAWSLLTKKDFPNQAGFSACLVWDKTLVTDTANAPSCVESDIDTANSVSSLKGQPVNIVGFTMSTGEALPVRSSVVSSPEEPVFIRSKSIYFPSIVKNVPLGDSFGLLKEFAKEVVSMADGGFKLLLRPRRCRVQYIASPPAFCYVNPDYMVTFVSSQGTGDILNFADNMLYITVAGDDLHTVTNINYFLGGISIKSSANWSSFGGSDLAKIDYVEF